MILQLQPAIEDTLRTVSPTRPPAIVQQLVLAAIQRVIAPWHRQREIEQAIKLATKELPLDLRQYSDRFPDLYPPTEWEARAMSTAREAVSHLAGSVSLAEIHAAAVAAGRQVASEYVAEQARAREERRQAAIKACLVSQGVAEVGRHLRELQSRDEILDKDLARQVEIEKLVRATLEQRLTGSESSWDALRMAREVVNEEVRTSRRSASMMSKRSSFMV